MGFFSGSTKVTKDPYGALNPEQVAVTKQLGPMLQSSANQATPYTGQLTEPISSEETAGLDQYSRLNALAGQGFESALSKYSPENINQFFTDYVEKPTIDAYTSNTLPILTEEMPSFSESKGRFISRGMADLAGTLGKSRFDALMKSPEILSNLSRGINESGTTSAALMSIPRELKQAGLDRQYADFIRQNTDKQNSINQMLSFLGISTGTATVRNESSGFDKLLATVQTAANVVSALNKGGSGTPTPSTSGSSSYTPSGTKGSFGGSPTGL